ncbi:MAG: TIM barrel protein [bacterium]|nr:TIM barrel protein [bacterium]
MTRRSFLETTAAMLATGATAGTFAKNRPGAWQPRVAENIGNLDEVTLRWMAQLGLKWVDLQGTAAVDRDKKGWWSPGDIAAVRQRCREFGLELACITVPFAWQMNSMLGKPERDTDIENIRRSILAVGEAGVPVFQYRWSPDFYWGEEMGYRSVEGRGGAIYKAFDNDIVKNQPPFEGLGVIPYDELWDRLMYFLKPLAEAAEMANVKLSRHPKDPPQPVVRGIARLFTNIDQMERFLDAEPSPASGFTFCQGTVTEMGVDVIDAIRRIGGRGRIHHVHFRAVRGRVPKYVETFIDEGDVDMLEAMRTYKEVGYLGAIVSDHTPKVTGDVAGGKIGRSFSHGYIRALIQAVNAAG